MVCGGSGMRSESVCVWGGVRVSYLLVGEPWKHLVHRTLWQMLTAVSVCRVE